MEISYHSLFFAFVSLILLIVSDECRTQEISDQCLGCICHASSGCDQSQGCSEAGVCGPFLITWAFWADGGKLLIKGTNPEDPNAYANCTKDMYCAAETVRAYMRKYAKDCNGDGKIDCEDYGLIHKNGPGSCGGGNIFQSEYYQKFSECKSAVNPQ